MRIIRRTAGLALVLLSISWAEQAIFDKSTLIATGGAKPTPVSLIISDVGVTIRSKAKTASVIFDLPYGIINKIRYGYLDQRKASLLPLIGITALFIKGQSHWLVIESTAGSVNDTTVLRLDKTEYRDVLAALNSKSGKDVEMLAPGNTLVDPTIGSHDEDETVPFHIDQVIAALKPAMEQYSCKVGKTKTNRVECHRGLRPPDGVGGGVAFGFGRQPN